MIKFELYNGSFFESLNYELDKEQKSFTSDIGYCVQKREDEGGGDEDIVSIIHENEPVGFFVLHFGDDKYNLTDNMSSVLLRSFSINPLYQGRGIGSAAVLYLTEYVKLKFPDINEIVLSVNFKNLKARDLYLKTGFFDGGKIIEGQMGPQHILSKKINE